MRFCFHEYAESEFSKVVDYYEDCQFGHGLEFAQEVYATIDLIVRFPEAWAPMSENSRRCLVNRFPFSVIYQVKSGIIGIIAVADLRQRPGYWLLRK
jgi:hypothetical protein